MGSKVFVSVVWGVETLFGAKTRAAEATWDSMNALQQQEYIRQLVLGELTESITEQVADPVVESESESEPKAERAFWFIKDGE